MAKKGEEILRQRKEAKQKKLLFVLGPIFLLLMVWQGPGYVKMLTGGGSEPTAATTSTRRPARRPTRARLPRRRRSIPAPYRLPRPQRAPWRSLIPINRWARTPDSSSPSDAS